MVMTGADADGLDRLAKLFDDAATSLLSSQKLIRTRLVNSPWDGRDAHAFRSDWERSHKPTLMSTAQYLRDAGNTLRRNATEQRRASAAESRLVSGIKDFVNHFGMNGYFGMKMAEMARVAAIVAPLRDEMRDLIGRSPEEQAAWWASLTDEQRRLLMENEPGRLTGLAGLPDDVRAEATERFLEQRKKEIVVETRKETVGGEVSIPIKIVNVEAGLEASGEITTFADGHAEVSLSLHGELGVSVGKHLGEGVGGTAGVGVGGTATMHYTFASKEEAQAFLDGLTKEIIPTKGEWVKNGVGGLIGDRIFGGNGPVDNLAEDITKDVEKYLDANSSRYESTTLTGEMTRSLTIKAGPVEVAVEGGAHASYNSARGYEVGLELRGNAAADLGFVGGSADASVGFDVATDKGGNLTSLTIHGRASGTNTTALDSFFQQNGGPVSIDAGNGYEMKFEAKVDLSDPYIREQAGALIKAAAAGDRSAGPALQALLRESDVSVGLNTTTSTHQAVGSGGNGVYHDTSTSTNVVTVVKAPGGGWVTYTPESK